MRTLKLAVPVLCMMAGYATWSYATTTEGALQAQREGAIAYISGGVGLEEREQLTSMSNRFNLKVTVAARDGDYLSDVRLRIRDRHGNQLVDTLTAGPLFYADLHPGTYLIEASRGGRSSIKTASVSNAKQTQLIFTW